MKRLLLFISAFQLFSFSAFQAAGQPTLPTPTVVTVTADPDTGVLKNPTNFFAANGVNQTAAPRGYAISDGATSNRAEILTPGTIGAVAGLPMTILAEVDVPTSNPAESYLVCALNSSTSFNVSNFGLNTNCLNINFGTGGALNVNQRGSGASDSRTLSYSGFRAAYSGQLIRIGIIFTAGDSTTSPRIEINGVDVTSSFTASTSGTPPNWMPPSMATTYFLAGYNWPSGRVPYVRAVIGAFSTAESEAWGKYGTMPAWATFAGSAVTFTAGTATNGSTGFSTFTGASTTGVSDLQSTGGLVRFGFSAGSFFANQDAIIRITITRSSGDLVMVPQLRSGSVNGSVVATADGLDGSGTYFFRITPNTSGTLYVVFAAQSSGQTFVGSVSDFAVWNGGLIDDPSYQPALATYDRLWRISRRLLGFTPVSTTHDFTIFGDTSTSGNQQLLGGATFSTTTDVVLDSIENITLSGTPTITVGSASGGSQYVSSVALSAGINPATLVTRKVASTSVWVGSDDTTQVRTVVRGHKVSTPAQ